MYATVADMRAEGVTVAQASDERLGALIDEATMIIDQLTGWFFEPRVMRLYLDGPGTRSIEPPYPPIRVMRLTVDGKERSRDAEDLLVVGAPVQPGFYAPRLTLLDGTVFPKGDGNVSVRARWGYTEDDGSSNGRTPLAIRRACMMLVLRNLPLLADEDEVADARNRWRVIEEKTRDQSYKLDKTTGPTGSAALTGDPEIDTILLRYRRPSGLGAV
ncbi:MAG: hypothetical protein GY854_25135 [Deltaproteobacteria bacterium]|nr:hypothetical protein [Deltaproteobacteria bacterium]